MELLFSKVTSIKTVTRDTGIDPASETFLDWKKVTFKSCIWELIPLNCITIPPSIPPSLGLGKLTSDIFAEQSE